MDIYWIKVVVGIFILLLAIAGFYNLFFALTYQKSDLHKSNNHWFFVYFLLGLAILFAVIFFSRLQ